MNVRRTPRVVVIEPGISSWLDGHKTIGAVLIGKRATCSGKVGIEWRGVLVLLMDIAASRIRLPYFNQGTRYGTSVGIEHAPGHDNSFASRLIRMLAR